METRHYRDTDMTEETYTENMTDSHRRHRDEIEENMNQKYTHVHWQITGYCVSIRQPHTIKAHCMFAQHIANKQNNYCC